MGDSAFGETPKKQEPLAEFTLVFLKVGTIANGWPAAHVIMMEDEFVQSPHRITGGVFLMAV